MPRFATESARSRSASSRRSDVPRSGPSCAYKSRCPPVPLHLLLLSRQGGRTPVSTGKAMRLSLMGGSIGRLDAFDPKAHQFRVAKLLASQRHASADRRKLLRLIIGRKVFRFAHDLPGDDANHVVHPKLLFSFVATQAADD